MFRWDRAVLAVAMKVLGTYCEEDVLCLLYLSSHCLSCFDTLECFDFSFPSYCLHCPTLTAHLFIPTHALLRPLADMDPTISVLDTNQVFLIAELLVQKMLLDQASAPKSKPPQPSAEKADKVGRVRVLSEVARKRPREKVPTVSDTKLVPVYDAFGERRLVARRVTVSDPKTRVIPSAQVR
jgi:hypothetical protein